LIRCPHAQHCAGIYSKSQGGSSEGFSGKCMVTMWLAFS
jgi:hypothetical protein